MSAPVSATVDVAAPLRTVYDQWTQFERFPEFMSAVEEVRQVEDDLLHWVVSVGGVRREFDARIVAQEPDRFITWTSTSGEILSGSVSFEAVSDDVTRVMLEMSWLPQTFVERVGASIDADEIAVQRDLERFKRFIEGRAEETGGWRGRIDRDGRL